MSPVFAKRELSDCEELIMKAVWDAREDIAIPDLIEALRINYGKDYQRTTVVTFLSRLAAKNYVETYRKGRLSYAHAIKSEDEYKQYLARRELDFWFHGDVGSYVSALTKGKDISEADIEKIRGILDEFDC